MIASNYLWEKLFGDTVSPNNPLFGDTVSPNNLLFGDTVSPNNSLIGDTVSQNNLLFEDGVKISFVDNFNSFRHSLQCSYTFTNFLIVCVSVCMCDSVSYFFKTAIISVTHTQLQQQQQLQ